MKTVLVTGGASFIGAIFIHLIANNFGCVYIWKRRRARYGVVVTMSAIGSSMKHDVGSCLLSNSPYYPI